MSVSQLSSTTLGTAAGASTVATGSITASQTQFVLGSTTGMTAQTNTGTGTILVVGKEAMKVLSIPVAGTVVVQRGIEGTIARPAAAAVRVWFGTPNQFQAVRDLLLATVQDPSSALPQYPTPGNKVTDGFGNEFVLCDFTGPVHSGTVVCISNDGAWTADAVAIGNRCVGVSGEQTSTSDQMGLVQIYGTCSGQEAGGTSAATSAYLPVLAGSVSSPATAMAALINTTSGANLWIYSMFITGIATTNVTSAASHTGVAVPLFLNYPYSFSVATDIIP